MIKEVVRPLKKFGKRLFCGLCYLFLYAPILVLIVFSFNESKNRARFTGFSLKWYEDLFHNDLLLGSLWNTLLVAVIASLLATVLGTIAAVGISGLKKRSRNMMMNITYLPVINPEIITGVSMMLLFVFLSNLFGWELGFWSVLIAHVTFCLPYVILNVLPKLRQMDPHLFEAAVDLGCTPTAAFFKVVLPEISTGIFSGLLMAFTFSLDDFIITYFTSGSSFQTLPVTIYSMVRMKVNPQVNALSAILFLAVLALLLLSNLVSSRKEKLEQRAG